MFVLYTGFHRILFVQFRLQMSNTLVLEYSHYFKLVYLVYFLKTENQNPTFFRSVRGTY
jgi:hypothetical protein